MKWEPRDLEQYPLTPGRQFYRRSWMGDKSATRQSHSKVLVYIEIVPGFIDDERGKFILNTHIGRGDGAYVGLGKRQQAEAEQFLAERQAEVEAELELLGWTREGGRCWLP